MSRHILALGAALCFVSTSALAGVVVVPYSGNYNEASAPAGDYDAIGGLEDVGQFNLLAGSNVFTGGIYTPWDSSDAFVISIASDQILVGASIVWGTNADDFNPIFAIPAPIWTLEESDADPTIFAQNLGGHNASSALTYSPSFTARGPGIYSMLIGNGVFGMNNGGAIGYQMTFTVQSSAPPAVDPVPEPAMLGLLGLGAVGLFAGRRRKAA